jgi:LPS-assembly protein
VNALFRKTGARRLVTLALLMTGALVGANCNGPARAQDIKKPGVNELRTGKESAILPTDIPIHISAERLSFNYDANTYTAHGNVTLSQGNVRLRADRITYEAGTGTLTAEGKVIVRTGADVVEADKVSIKLADAVGVLYNGKLLLSRQNIYLEGKKLEKTGDSTYRIEEGSFTTCDGARPDWRITGKDLDVTLEGYGRLKHGFFHVKEIPVFYIPWFMYPAKRTRQSGFLVPSFSNSSLRGFDVRAPFFVALGPSVDATVTPRLCTNRAVQAALEFRYIPTEEFRGRLYGEYTYDWGNDDGASPKYHRFFATLRHDQDLAGLARLKCDGTWVSDRDYFELWGNRFDKRNRVRYLESNAVVYRQSDNMLFQAEARHFDNLDLPDNSATAQNLPIVRIGLFDRQIPYTPFRISSNIVYDYFYAPAMHNVWLGNRLQMDAKVTLPLSLGPYLKLAPCFTYAAKAYAAGFYRNDRNVEPINAIRSDLFEVGADVFTDIERVYSSELFGFQRIKHAIRPRVTWTYRPVEAKRRYPVFDDTDKVDRVSLLNAELRQTLTGRLGAGRYLDFMSLIVSQGYDFDKASGSGAASDEGANGAFGWTNTHFELAVRPHTLVDLSSQIEYDPSVNRLRKYGVGVGLMDHRGDTLRIFHQFAEGDMREDLNRQTNLGLQFKVGSNLDCFFESQYTHQFSFAYFTSLGLVYHPQCWNLELKYSETRAQDPSTGRIKTPDQTLFMTVSLYGLGQVYRMTRDWGDIFGPPSGSAEGVTRSAAERLFRLMD